MGKPLSFDQRVKIIRDRYQRKLSYKDIALEIGCSEVGVKKICRLYKEKGEAAYKADYSRCGKTDRHHFSEDIVNQVNFYREGQIGAYYVYSILKETYPEDRVPSPRTMQRMWEKAGGTPRKKRRKGQSANSWTKEVHHTWQIDGKEQIRLGSGEEVSWVNIADEATSTSLHAEVFPPQEDI